MKKLIIAVSMLTLSTSAVVSPDEITKMVCNAMAKISYDIVDYKNKGLSKIDIMNVHMRLGGDDAENSPRAKEIDYIYDNEITDPVAHQNAQFTECVTELTK